MTSTLRAWAHRYPLVLVAAAIVLYATGPVMVAASSVTGPVLSFWRLWIGVGVLGVLTALQHAAGVPWPSRTQWRVAIGAGVAFGAHQLLLFTAVRIATVVDVTLVGALSPVVTGLGARWMFGERPGPRFWSWAAIAIVGTGLLAVAASSAPSGSPVGMTLALVNVVAFAAFYLLSKRGRDHLPVVPFLFATFTVAAVVVSVFVVTAGQDISSVRTTDVLLAAGIAVGPGTLGHFLMTWPLRYVPANIPPVMRLMVPFVAGALAWWLLGQPLSWRHLLAGALIVAGAAGVILSGDGRRLRARARRRAPETSRRSGRDRRRAGDPGR